MNEDHKQSDLKIALRLQRDYDELQEDCKHLLNVILNLKNGKPEPFMIEFNDVGGWPAMCYQVIHDYATWKPKNEENEQHNV